MAPNNISPGSAATVLSFLALAGLQLETRFRVGEVLAAPRPELSEEPEPELPLGRHLEAWRAYSGGWSGEQPRAGRRVAAVFRLMIRGQGRVD